jgi:hypothetical protein
MDINILKPHEKDLFLFPLSDSDIVERVGVEPHSSLSLLYACLSAYEPKFRTYSDQKKGDTANVLMSDITKIAKVEKWNEYSTSERGQLTFKKILIEKLQTTDIISEPNNALFTAVPINELISIINDIDTDITVSIREYIPYITTTINMYVEKKLKSIIPIIIPEQITKMVDKIYNIIRDYIPDTYSSVYKKFESDTKDYQPNMMTCNKKHLSWLSECLNRDLFIINSINFIPYKTGITNKRKTLIILSHRDKHYEFITKTIGSESISEFYSTDPLIKRMTIFTYQPEIVCEIYPHLVHLLPKQYQVTLKKYHSKCSPNRKSPLNNRLFRD